MVVLVLFAILAFLVYLPVLNKGFASDDFGVMHRIINQGDFLETGFFRPLSDISLYCCYWAGGLTPWVYNLFNILLHAGSAFLLFKTVQSYFGEKRAGNYVAGMAGIFFLVYPFHNESIVWVVGRASILSCFLGFYSIYVALGEGRLWWKIVLSALLYFLAMSTYETVAPLPAIILILLYKKEHRLVFYFKWAGAFLVVLLLNLGLRLFLSQEVVGDYGSRIFDPSLIGNTLKFAKVFGRLWLPPLTNATLLVGLTIAVVMLLTIAGRVIIRRKNNDAINFTKLGMVFLVSCLVPFLFGVSTRTIEGDRLLYFPSWFLAWLLAYVIFELFSRKVALVISLLVTGYFFLFLQENNRTWTKADGLTKEVLVSVSKIIRGNKEKRSIAMLNLPEEYYGAQVLRNGFYSALLLRGIDTSGIGPLGFQGPSEIALKTRLMEPQHRSSLTWFGSYAALRDDGLLYLFNRNNSDTLTYTINKEHEIYYWNNEELVKWR